MIILLATVTLILTNSFFLQEPNKLATATDTAHKFYEKCKLNNQPPVCYEDQFRILAKRLSFQENVQILKNLQKIDRRTNICHSIAHAISSETVAKNPDNWTGHLKSINPTECSSGFIHGAIEGLKRFNSEISINSNFVKKTCDELSLIKKTSQQLRIKYTCAHAMGHILLVEKEANINSALNECPISAQSLTGQCYRGVFMESTAKTNLSFHGITAKQEFSIKEIKDQEKICYSYTGEKAVFCWDSISILYLQSSKGNFSKVFESCDQAPEEKMKVECYTSAVQYLYSQYELRQRYINRKDLCSPYQNYETGYNKCIEKILGVAIESRSPNSAENFCKEVPGKYNNFCFKKIKSITKSVNLE